MACSGATFGLVQLEGALAFVGKDNLGVFTKYRFRILDDWNAAKRPGPTTIHLIMEGGEVEHRGEKVRVENLNAKYQIDRQYVLVAGRGPTVYDAPPLIEVIDDTIYPAPDSAPFRSGTTIAQAKAAIGRALQKWPCK